MSFTPRELPFAKIGKPPVGEGPIHTPLFASMVKLLPIPPALTSVDNTDPPMMTLSETMPLAPGKSVPIQIWPSVPTLLFVPVPPVFVAVIAESTIRTTPGVAAVRVPDNGSLAAVVPVAKTATEPGAPALPPLFE